MVAVQKSKLALHFSDIDSDGPEAKKKRRDRSAKNCSTVMTIVSRQTQGKKSKPQSIELQKCPTPPKQLSNCMDPQKSTSSSNILNTQHPKAVRQSPRKKTLKLP